MVSQIKQIKVVRVDPANITSKTATLPLEVLGEVEVYTPPPLVIEPVRHSRAKRQKVSVSASGEQAARMKICLEVIRQGGWLNGDELRTAFSKELGRSVSQATVSSYVQSFKREGLITVRRKMETTNGIRVWKEYYGCNTQYHESEN